MGAPVGCRAPLWVEPCGDAVAAQRNKERDDATKSTTTQAIAATGAEGRARAANDAELQTSTLGDRPLIVLVAGQSLADIAHWEEAQRRQAAPSSRGVMRVSRNSSHAIQWDDPVP